MEGTITEVQLARQRLLENRAWIDENIEGLQERYKDRWIVVIDKKVIAEGETPQDLSKFTQGKEEEALVMKIPTVIRKPI